VDIGDGVSQNILYCICSRIHQPRLAYSWG